MSSKSDDACAVARGRTGHLPELRRDCIGHVLLVVRATVADGDPVDRGRGLRLGFASGDDFIQEWTPRAMLISVPVFAVNTLSEVWNWLAVDTWIPEFYRPLLMIWFPGYLFLGLRRIEGGSVRAVASTLASAIGFAVIFGVIVVAILWLTGQWPPRAITP